MIPQHDVARCGLSWAAKIACSGRWITGRDPMRVLAESAAWTYAEPAALIAAGKARDPGLLLEGVTVTENESLRSVTLAKDGVEGHARYFAGAGAMIVDAPEGQPFFAPPPERAPVTTLPLGDPAHSPIDRARLTEAVDLMFADPRQMTNAYVVVHRGAVVAERYREPFGPATRFESWSQGKSIASTLIGMSARRGLVSLDEDQLFPEWCAPGDPRAGIRLRHILNMSSGLSFTGSFGRNEDTTVKARDGLFLDHIYVYAGGVDSYAFCLAKPAELAPGAQVRYRNCDPLLAMSLLRARASDGRLADALNWPYRELFAVIGADGYLLETDPHGGFLISGHDYATARDWARMGQLWLQRGAWDGVQLMDESYVDFALTPAPGGDEPYYGGFVILNRTGIAPGLPLDAFWFSGGGGQRTVVVPSLDLVIVRLGHIFGDIFKRDETMQAANRLLVAAVG